jgi:hypothetical protein
VPLIFNISGPTHESEVIKGMAFLPSFHLALSTYSADGRNPCSSVLIRCRGTESVFTDASTKEQLGRLAKPMEKGLLFLRFAANAFYGITV